MTKWYAKKLIYCHCFSFWRQLFNFYQPSLDKYNTCLCRTITALFSTFKIARTCFCCVCIISLTAMSKHRSWGGGRAYIYIQYIMRIIILVTFTNNRSSSPSRSILFLVTVSSEFSLAPWSRGYPPGQGPQLLPSDAWDTSAVAATKYSSMASHSTKVVVSLAQFTTI